MSGQFFICGLPRSRTAWFSVITSTQRSICYHEPTAQTQSFDDLLALWKPVAGISVGVSDSGLTSLLGRILDAVGPRTLIIERPLDGVLASFDGYMDGAGLAVDLVAARAYLQVLQTEMEKRRNHPLVKSVKFADLNDYNVVSDCLAWLLPDIEFPDLKFLMTMNIQVRREHVISLLQKPHTHWHLDMEVGRRSSPLANDKVYIRWSGA